MTFAPQTLKELGAYVVNQGVVNLGIVGDTAHAQKGTSYHLGKDLLLSGAYSTQHPRDRNPTLAASAIDLGKVAGTLAGLQALSVWLSSQCQRRAIDTLDIREVIYSPDGTKVLRWDEPTQTVYLGGTGTGQGDDSHRTHTHVSYFRDSETRDKVALFRRYFEEEVMRITAVKGEDWRPTTNTAGVSNGVLRRVPSRTAPLVKDAQGDVVRLSGIVRTIAEVSGDGNDWRLTEYDAAPAYFLRSDLTPVTAGGDPAVDQALTDYLARKAPDCTDAELAGRQAEWDRIVPSVTAIIPPRP